MSSHECAVTTGCKHLLSQGFKTAARDHICKFYDVNVNCKLT